MTHKQIIIDGIDVRGCKNFYCGICEEENKIPRTINHFTTDCRMYPNCNYKQLKRKEQVLDEIKEYFKSKDKRKTSLFNIFVIEQEILGIINKG